MTILQNFFKHHSAACLYRGYKYCNTWSWRLSVIWVFAHWYVSWKNGHNKGQKWYGPDRSLLAVLPWWLRSLGLEDPLEKEMATPSSILAWRITWTEELRGLQSMGSQRVGPEWASNMILTEAEEIKKRCQDYTEELYEKGIHGMNTRNGVITHLVPNILECWSQVGVGKNYYALN